jgi:mono/diheme cytochrome c family protein
MAGRSGKLRPESRQTAANALACEPGQEKNMRIAHFLLPILLAAACASELDPATLDPKAAEGRYLVKIHCADCHAIDRRDHSKHPEAPPFRDLSKRYPVASLEESLAEGIVVGHPEMPEFRFRPEDVAAIISWLEAIQER